MTIFLYTTFFILGTIIGSFLNVVIFRLNTERHFGGRSACLFCRHKLSWYELLPVFSYFFLRGRCRLCKSKISVQYPLVELGTGLVFLGLFAKFQNVFYLDVLLFSSLFSFYAILFCILMVISVYDLRHKIIPDSLSLIFGFISFIGIFIFVGNYFLIHLPKFSDILSGLVVSVPFALLWYFSKGEWMGLGDAKLAVGLGFMLGIGKMISATTLAFWIGAIFGVLFILAKKLKKGLKSEIPFAPFLALGAVLAFFFDLDIFSLFFN